MWVLLGVILKAREGKFLRKDGNKIRPGLTFLWLGLGFCKKIELHVAPLLVNTKSWRRGVASVIAMTGRYVVCL